MDWNTKTVLQMVGIEPDKATPIEIDYAVRCIADCYYLDRAAERLARILRGPAFLHESTA